MAYDENAGTVTICAKKYSVYSVAYNDAPDESAAAATGDASAALMMGFGALALAAILSAVIAISRKLRDS